MSIRVLLPTSMIECQDIQHQGPHGVSASQALAQEGSRQSGACSRQVGRRTRLQRRPARSQPSHDGVQCAAHSDPEPLGLFSVCQYSRLEDIPLVLRQCTQPQAGIIDAPHAPCLMLPPIHNNLPAEGVRVHGHFVGRISRQQGCSGHLRDDTSCAWYCASRRASGCSGSAAPPNRRSSAACSASPVGRSASAVPVAMRKPTSTRAWICPTSQSPAQQTGLRVWGVGLGQHLRLRRCLLPLQLL
jgi:hypothetical protein